MPIIAYLKSPLDPSKAEYYHPAEGVNLLAWMKKKGFTDIASEQPLIVIKNGVELFEAEWDCDLLEDDKIGITILAEGLEPLTIFYIVLFVISVAMFLTMPLPENPNVDTEEGSPTYSISARGNKARIGQPKPILYGKMRTYPDLSARPYNEFNAQGDQYVYQLFELTQGQVEVDLASARFEDTVVTSFDNYEIEIVEPGEKSELYPSVVVTSSEVSSLQLETELGPYTANEVGTEATRITVDIVAPAGMYSSNDEGGLANYRVQYQLEAREIDDNDLPISGWVILGTHWLSGSTRDPIRKTHEYAVTPSRYEIKLIRLTAKNTSIRISDAVSWTALRAFIGETSLTTTTRIAIRIRASEQIGNAALNKFNLVTQRKLPLWDNITGWSAPVATSNPAWAFADACRQHYGGNRSDAFIDLLTVEQYAAIFDSEGTEFNGVFDSKNNLWAALTQILMPAMCQPVDNFGTYTFVRDEQKSVPIQAFTMRNIVKDSFRIEHTGVLEETSDSIRAFFYDSEQDYRETSFISSLEGGTTNNPKEIDLFGVTDAQKAFDLAMYMNAQNYYRRERFIFKTGIEGRIPFKGDLVSLQHYSLARQEDIGTVAGDIKALEDGNLLTLTDRVDGVDDPHLVIRDPLGVPTDPLEITVESPYQIRVTDPAFDPSDVVFEQGYERPKYVVGEGVEFMALAKVDEIKYTGNNIVEIKCYRDAPEVYDAAGGLPLPPIDQLPPASSLTPVVTSLTASVQGTDAEPIVALTWNGARADYYEIEYSIDGGLNYLDADEGRNIPAWFRHQPGYIGSVLYRVAGVNLLRGAWVSIAVDTGVPSGELVDPDAPTGLALRESFVGDTLKLEWVSETFRNKIEFWNGAILRRSEAVDGTQFDLLGVIAQTYGLGRSFDVRVYAISDANVQSSGYASLSVSNPAPAVLNNLVVTPVFENAIISFDTPTDTDFSGVSVWASPTAIFTPSDANKVIDTSLDPVLSVALTGTLYIVAAANDVWGTTGLNYSGENTAAGGQITETQIADDSISTPKLQASSVTAAKIFVSQLSAIAADVGVLTAGLFKTNAGTSERVEIEGGHQFPFWIGNGAKTEANANVFYDATDDRFVIRDPVSGFYFEVDPNDATYPFKMVNAGNTKGIKYNKLTDTLELTDIKATGEIEADTIKAGSVAIIDTLMLQGQAVTIPTAVYTAGATNITGNNWQNWTQFQSITVSATGSVQLVSFSFSFKVYLRSYTSGSSTYWFETRLKRDGAVVANFGYFWGDASSNNNITNYANVAHGYSGQPAAGSRTYTLEIRCSRFYDVSSYCDVSAKDMTVLEVKR